MILKSYFHPSWHPLLYLLNQEPFLTFLTTYLPNCLYYPSKDKIFRVFKMPLSDIKVVVLGEEPYIGPNVATGHAFAVSEQSSLSLVLKRVEEELDQEGFFFENGLSWRTLEHWEMQGVFLLNTSLTTEPSSQDYHALHWKNFIIKVIQFISINQPCIWLFWGDKMFPYSNLISNKDMFKVKNYTLDTIKHIPQNPYYNYVLKTVSPLDKKFLGCNHFRFTNTILHKLNKKQINW